MEARKKFKRKQQGTAEQDEEQERRVVRRFRQHAPMAGEGSGAKKIRDQGMLKAVFQG